MNQNKETFYKVTMRVEVERTVLAGSEEEARENVDASDMIYEIKSYGFDEELIVEEIEDSAPDAYDRIDHIGEQIVQHHSEPMYMLRERYAEIRKINQKLAKAGKPTHEPVAFMRMTDHFLNLLKEK